QLKSTASGPQDRAREAYEAMLAEAKDSAPAVPWRYLDIGKSWAGRSLWNEAKDWISQWHSNPRLLLLYIRYYWQAYRSGATDITPYEFAAFSLEMMKVAPLNLFAVNTAPKKPEERGQPAAEPPQAVLSSSPLRLEVLNASGHRGQAVAVTMYLRKLALQERLPVDVLSYDNYSRREKKSRMISRTGRIDELAALATRLGLSAMEITAAPARASQTDASFIVGEDLNLPSER
ncbi:MAG TPA: LytR C-terminal domain-containing protein, partial [Elusimicrobiales bacterium]|nr:LytR C-terminal domain-containing protein [Elusimicrobiales bacterium]